jgi:hypothetical protein
MQESIASQIFVATSRGETPASNGWPWMATLGFREARTAQRNGFTAVRQIHHYSAGTSFRTVGLGSASPFAPPVRMRTTLTTIKPDAKIERIVMTSPAMK